MQVQECKGLCRKLHLKSSISWAEMCSLCNAPVVFRDAACVCCGKSWEDFPALMTYTILVFGLTDNPNGKVPTSIVSAKATFANVKIMIITNPTGAIVFSIVHVQFVCAKTHLLKS